MSDAQGRLFPDTVAGATAKRDAALRQVEDHADPAWLAEATTVVEGYLRTHPTMFVDDLWRDTELERPREARALGAVFRHAALEGLMVKSGQYRPSVSSRMAPKPVWRSLVYVEEDAGALTPSP